MFDWEDKEFTNMIWGADGETGDHIVPFKVRTEQLSKKENGEEESKTVKSDEQKITETKSDLHDSSSGHNVDEGIRWADSSISNAREADQDLSVTDELSKCLAEPEKTSELGKGPDIFLSTDESRKEQGDFDEDYGWANIVSFDDLDRMFSNDDVPRFGNGSLSSADELWPTSKDVSNSRPSILDSLDLGLDIRTEFEQQENQQFPLTGKANASASQSWQVVCAVPKAEKHCEHEDQTYQQNKMMKFSKVSGTHDMYGQRTLSRNPPQLMPPSHYPHMPNQYMTSGYGNLRNPYSPMPVIHPFYNPATAISLNNSRDASTRPSTMTPQEKLEKLRRRQQMQAMLAIQRQHQQFRHHLPVPDQSITQFVDKTMSSATVSTAVDDSAEFSVLHRLQDVVAKLDTGTRTCIRDSLFRLAGSAGQRHHTSKKSSQDEQEVVHREESRYRYGGIPDTETVTNPTDRIVAHLLFHRPFDSLVSRDMGGPESPVSSKMGSEEKVKSPKNIARDSSVSKQEEAPSGSLALVNAPNSGPSSTVVEASSQGNKRKL